jgi:NADH-quinone oxidoreductase subunit A
MTSLEKIYYMSTFLTISTEAVPQGELSGFATVLLYILCGSSFVGITLAIASWLRPNRPNAEKNAVYECGEDAVGEARVNLNARYYIPALLFVLFELEIIFLFPMATVFSDSDLQYYSNGTWMSLALIEITVFIVLLGWGLVYAWNKGYLEWDKPTPETEEMKSVVPDALYEKINQTYQG